MALKPLEQWFCDRCGELIENVDDGWVHWRREKDIRGVYAIEILHHLKASPRGPTRPGCYPDRMELDMPLKTMIGPRGIAALLSMMDVGAYHDPDGEYVGGVKDIRNWTEVFRRLHIPHYEEARRYFKEGRRDGELEGINEVALYTVGNLQGLIARYGEPDEDELDDDE